ncbi:AraC family transcriptional regulator [Niastella koreensis]|uniref:Transcriptional regulator, AraC family n=2 Tax=Niastella koreensis TaxID=354356 RepID=G8TFX0_NIAKG|nr:chromate resistance protein ChrB domain-containing protein [Niastella koreensis]AEW00569.1 transcriptional regulator, AraC family [Niastella koreensis GR20-10]OQP52428.1 AraC family transcriptional regulator [Niastella koreensis]
MKWITREHPKIDRLACPWLIRRFIDPQGEIIYVPFDEVLNKAAQLDAIPFDIPGVEYTHYGAECTFDYLIKKHNIKDTAVHAMAPVVRGADTDHHEIAVQAAGLWAISAGLAYNHKDDYELLEKGMLIYDALYSWAKHLQKEKHTQQPFENLLLEVFNRFLKSKKGTGKKIPAWAQELKDLIQDHIDTNLSLKELSKDLSINPSYLSREFSKHFNNLSFGEYIRKQRIEKAMELMATPTYSLTEIAYLTGFSDQSHFTRIFKKHNGISPSEYRKNIDKK